MTDRYTDRPTESQSDRHKRNDRQADRRTGRKKNQQTDRFLSMTFRCKRCKPHCRRYLVRWTRKDYQSNIYWSRGWRHISVHCSHQLIRLLYHFFVILDKKQKKKANVGKVPPSPSSLHLSRLPCQFVGTHVYPWVGKDTEQVKCLAWKHITMTRPAIEPRPLDPESNPLRVRQRVTHER